MSCQNAVILEEATHVGLARLSRVLQPSGQSRMGSRQGELQIRAFVDADAEQVIALWSRCGLLRPWNDPRKDIARKLQVQRELFMVGEMDGRVVAVVMVGYEGHRGWVKYLAVEPQLQRRGLGREMMAAAERRLSALGCPKIQLQIRHDHPQAVGFYRRLGYTEDAVVSMGKRLVEDDST